LKNVPTSTGRSKSFQSGVLQDILWLPYGFTWIKKIIQNTNRKVYAAASAEVTTTV